MRHTLPGFMLLVAFFFFTPAVTEESDPLRDEDIVRLFVGGVSTASVIETIRTQSVDFDLSTEMLEELRLAGLPQIVIDTMIERQSAQDQDASSETDEVGTLSTLPPLEPDLAVSFDSSTDEPISLTLPAYIPRTYFDRWNLSGPDGLAQDIAIFLACSNPLHVPDHWRSKSPLGRVFDAVPRHRMLAFISGATVIEAGKTRQLADRLASGARDGAQGNLALEIPSTLSAILEPGETHDLLLGIAVQAADRLFVLQSDSWENVRSQTGLHLSAEIKQPKRSPYAGLQILFKKPAEQTEQD